MKPGRLYLVMMQAMLASGIAQAAGFGEITLHSRIGEKLRAEVPLIVAQNETPESRCFSLTALPGVDLTVITDARLSLNKTASGYSLLIESNQAVDEPLLMIGLRAACGINQQRDYVLMPESAPVRLEMKPIPEKTAIRGNTPGFGPAAAPATARTPTAAKPAQKQTSPGTKPITRPGVPNSPRPKAASGSGGDRLLIGQAPIDSEAPQAGPEQTGEMESRMLRMESSLSSLRDEVDHLQSAVELGAQVAAAKHELRLAQNLDSPLPTEPVPEPPRQTSIGNWLQLLVSALAGGIVSALLAIYLSKRLSRQKSPR